MLCEYCIITANPPRSESIAAAVLLRTIADDHLYTKVRDDLNVVLEREIAEIVLATVEMFSEQAAQEGGAAILSRLEDTLSNFLAISPRLEIVGTGEIDTLIGVLCSRHWSCPH